MAVRVSFKAIHTFLGVDVDHRIRSQNFQNTPLTITNRVGSSYITSNVITVILLLCQVTSNVTHYYS